MKKEKIMLAVVFIMIIASAWVLYDNFGASGPSGIIDTSMVEEQSSQARVRSLESNIEASIRNLKPGGAWAELQDSPQYQSLSDDSVIEIEIGEYGRDNPFVPVDYAGTLVE